MLTSPTLAALLSKEGGFNGNIGACTWYDLDGMTVLKVEAEMLQSLTSNPALSS